MKGIASFGLALLLCALPRLAAAQEESSGDQTTATAYVIPLNDSVSMLFRFVPTDTGDFAVNSQGDTTGHVRGFFIAATEVTQQQWQAVAGPRAFCPAGDGLPATGMSLEEVLRFIRLMDSSCRMPVRLPTCEEWLLAAYGGERYAYPGDRRADPVAWHAANCRGLQAVAQKVPNRFGLFDMSGNAAEWAEEVPEEPAGDGTAPIYYTPMGGSCASSAEGCRLPPPPTRSALLRSRAQRTPAAAPPAADSAHVEQGLHQKVQALGVEPPAVVDSTLVGLRPVFNESYHGILKAKE